MSRRRLGDFLVGKILGRGGHLEEKSKLDKALSTLFPFYSSNLSDALRQITRAYIAESMNHGIVPGAAQTRPPKIS